MCVMQGMTKEQIDPPNQPKHKGAKRRRLVMTSFA
jgi:hypothetical protein